MYPEYNNSYLERNPNKRLVILKWAAILIPIMLILLAIISFLLRPNYTEFSATTTELKSQQNYGYISNNELYAYNGLLFYKQDLKTGDITPLSEGQRLPQIERMFWAGDNGVLLKFSGSFAATEVERIFGVTANDINSSLPEMIESYTWFYDFKTNSLRQVAETNVLPNLAYYSKEESKFYLITYDEIGPSPHTPVLSYDIKNNSSTQISYGDHLTDVSAINRCPVGTDARVCFVARDINKPTKVHLYSIKKSEEKKSILESDGKILPTNNPNFYLTTSDSTEPTSHSTNSVAGTDIPGESKVIFHDLQNKTSRTLDFTAGSADPMMYILNNNRFYVLHTNRSDQTDNTIYRSGELTGRGSNSKEMIIQNSAGEDFDGTINFVNSAGSDGLTLATTIDDRQVILSQDGVKPSLSPFVTVTDARSAVDKCATESGAEIDYYKPLKQFRVIFVLNDSFTTSISNFAKCISSTNKHIFYGYNFQISGSDPFNGRISTN